MSQQIDFEKFQDYTPKVIEDFMEFYEEYFSDTGVSAEKFKTLPFEMQAGVFIRYFYENGIDIDFTSADMEDLADGIREALLEHEGVLNHFS